MSSRYRARVLYSLLEPWDIWLTGRRQKTTCMFLGAESRNKRTIDGLHAGEETWPLCTFQGAIVNLTDYFINPVSKEEIWPGTG